MTPDDLATLAKPANGNGTAGRTGSVAAGDRDDVIVFDNVHKGFGVGSKRTEPLRGVSLRVRRGERLVIIGPSGTGKSVTLRLMLGLLDPDSGTVTVEGRDLSGLDIDELGVLRKRMSMLFQSGALFDSMTVGENVAFPLRAAGERDEAKIAKTVAEKLRQVGLPDTEEKMTSELSGGMKKRAALARSIASRPDIILYDEPTTGLDPIMSDAIAELIIETHEKLRQECDDDPEGNRSITSIVVTHDMHVASKVADRIVMLYDGRVVGDAPPGEYRRLGSNVLPKDAGKHDQMIRQFVRGEAAGPIRTVT
ncbi:MAG: ATP-binding cassette domain-containing protein [Planctomycetota bacterium]|jgi:phospholipid/cholesterol/gamma-HCH transport system ATP-binding protein|nr:ATP-binding cassette domain-containing protein [Planctomycetota bacterium]